MTGAVLPTPFHARTAMRNGANAWTMRGAFTVPAHYGDPRQEALAARFTVAMSDVSATQDLVIDGSGAASLLATACGTPVAETQIGGSQAVHWCAEGGGLRGYGSVARLGQDNFLLRSADCDSAWFESAAARFGASVRDATRERGLLFLAGPFAVPALVAAGLEVCDLKEDHHAEYALRGLTVTVFRRARPAGYELSCRAQDAVLLFDRLVIRAGPLLALRLMGEDALQLLQLEAGLPLPHADFAPARELFACEPSPAALGLKDGRGAGESERRVLAGIEWDGDEPGSLCAGFRRRQGDGPYVALALFSGPEMRHRAGAAQPCLRCSRALPSLRRSQSSAGRAAWSRCRSSKRNR